MTATAISTKPGIIGIAAPKGTNDVAERTQAMAGVLVQPSQLPTTADVSYIIGDLSALVRTVQDQSGLDLIHSTAEYIAADGSRIDGSYHGTGGGSVGGIISGPARICENIRADRVNTVLKRSTLDQKLNYVIGAAETVGGAFGGVWRSANVSATVASGSAANTAAKVAGIAGNAFLGIAGAQLALIGLRAFYNGIKDVKRVFDISGTPQEVFEKLKTEAELSNREIKETLITIFTPIFEKNGRVLMMPSADGITGETEQEMLECLLGKLLCPTEKNLKIDSLNPEGRKAATEILTGLTQILSWLRDEKAENFFENTGIKAASLKEIVTDETKVDVVRKARTMALRNAFWKLFIALSCIAYAVSLFYFCAHGNADVANILMLGAAAGVLVIDGYYFHKRVQTGVATKKDNILQGVLAAFVLAGGIFSIVTSANMISRVTTGIITGVQAGQFAWAFYKLNTNKKPKPTLRTHEGGAI